MRNLQTRQILAALLLAAAAGGCLGLYQQQAETASMQTVAVSESRWPYLNTLTREDSTYSYDTCGNLLREDVYRNGEYDSCTLYTYNTDGEPVIRTEYEADGAVSDWSAFTYDGAGQLTGEVYRNYENTLLYTILYTYDADGRLLTETRYETDADSEIVEQTEYTYDSTGMLLETREYSRSAGETRTEYVTDAEGQILEYTQYDADGYAFMQVSLERDSYGDVTAVYYLDPDWPEADVYDFTYVRDEEGRLLQETCCFNGTVYYETVYQTVEVHTWNTAAAAAGMESGSVVTAEEAAALTDVQDAELSWSFDTETGILTISGTGEMIWDAGEAAPWQILLAEDGVTPLPASAVQAVVLESGLTSVRGSQFGYPNMTEITLPDSITKICRAAFAGAGLVEAALPEGLTELDRYVFSMCSSLTRIYIPAGVTDIRTGAFDGCTSLADVYYGGSEQDWAEITIYDDNEALQQAELHYNAEGLE